MNTRWKLNRYANAYKFHRIWPETVGFNGSDPFRKVAYFLSHPLSIFQVWLNPEWINVCIFDMLTRGDIPHVHEATSFLEVSHLLATGKANVNKHKIQFLLAPCVFARRLLLAFSSLFFLFGSCFCWSSCLVSFGAFFEGRRCQTHLKICNQRSRQKAGR